MSELCKNTKCKKIDACHKYNKTPENCIDYKNSESFKYYDYIHITKMPKQDKDEDVMIVSYDKGFQNEKSCLLVGHNSKGDLYIENEFTGYEADMIYKLLKREVSVYDIMK